MTEKLKYQKMVDMIALGMSVILCLFHMFSASYGTWTSYVLAAVHWGFIGSYIVLRSMPVTIRLPCRSVLSHRQDFIPQRILL